MNIRIILLLLVSFFWTSHSATAEDFTPSWYFHASAGGNWAEDFEAPGVSYEFDPGYRFSVGPGVQFGKHLAVEFETGLLWNDLDKITTGAGTVNADGEFWRVPLLVNLIGKLPIGNFTPYIGIGFGGIYEEVSATAGGATSSDDRFDSAFQGFLGLEYRISERLSVGASYKYLRTIIKDDDWFLYFGTPPEKPEDHGNHAITASLRLDF